VRSFGFHEVRKDSRLLLRTRSLATLFIFPCSTEIQPEI
jgi:hypothetical protein